MNLPISYKDVLALPPNTHIVMFERYGKPTIQRYIVKQRVPGSMSLWLAPPDDPTVDKRFVVNPVTFKQDPEGFALQTEMGQVLMRFKILDPIKTYQQQQRKVGAK